ncbi:DNA polymerase alpha catalytic subunit [Rickenella mellea]|uniref:DNA polymerase n=1 Tax=Rickenella mellea TaxID=50990 RepID=A0A4Y7Q7U0_9AGAM|nr:DNA polymerase alpha catalytic subunit [Rickenella mellea]
MADRSRRQQKSKLDKFEELKRAREGGKRVWKPEEDAEIYDEVDEDQYKIIVKGRLQRDDFIEDDGVEGYADNGMDDWGNGDEQESDIEEETKKAKKSKKAKVKPKPPPPLAPTINDYRPKPAENIEQDFMASLMGNMDSITPDTLSHSRKRKPRERSPSPPSSPGAEDFESHRASGLRYADTSSDGFTEEPPSDDLEQLTSPRKKHRAYDNGLTPATKRLGEIKVQGSSSDYDPTFDDAFDDVNMDDFMEVDDIISPKEEEKPTVLGFQSATSPLAKPAPNNAVKKNHDGNPAWLNIHANLAVEDTLGPVTSSGAAAVHASKITCLEDDGSLRFFWLDYHESDGKLFFVGKLKDKTSGAWVSCCVTVENLERNLFVLPREKRTGEWGSIEDGFETDVVPDPVDVYKDFDAIRKKAGITSFKGKFVKRKYAFGEPDVPTGETQWLKVVYPFSDPHIIPNNVSSPNFSRIFGTTTNAFELLVLKRKIMGPCWLEIKKPVVEHKGASWCKLEATVSGAKDINPFSETDANAPREMPPLTVMSLSVQTIVNHTANKREIVCTTARVWSNIQIDDPTPPDQLPCTVHTFVRPIEKFPANFQSVAQSNKKGLISPEPNERSLLNRLLVTIYKADPDVIVGHEFLGVSLDVLVTRMRDLKADNWSRIGRFRRSKWPNIGKQGTNLKFLNGRMLCDLASDGAKSMISSTTWSLTEMCATHLKCEREDIDPDEIYNYFDYSHSNPDKLLRFVRHCELDAHYQMAIAAKVQILPLTKQLTNLAGNSWNKTLNGGRAERNEYILLHEFHRLKYVCPDKHYGKKSAAVVKQEVEEGDTAVATTKGKKDKYKGGLVFEPKRGLWDKYILVMDFNSLYPSIIQEYNIDFTTIDRVESDDGEEKIPEPPSSDVPQGVLPRLIATLVNRRRQVKSLMKDRTATPAKMLQWDIKQQALKLTANSMYGCLGFEYSRFYARPLAALTTFKGREILTHTRELAESLHLDVVYGDTDSVFVNSNVTDFAEALKISHEFKKQVNDRYKLLEIDLDGVFQRLLLLQKKKYAAIKMEDATRTSTEIKGLDMKRREYCALSKNVSQYVLSQILSGEATETVVENIHEYLNTLGTTVRSGKTPLEEFIVFKRLGKNPEDYPDAKSQPHVQVALRMKSKGHTPRGGDVIPYIFCLGEDGQASTKTAQADKAHHPDEIRKADSTLQIDFEYYLSQQILPPIERLCDPIEGTDRARLAECLGLDPARYRSHASGDNEEQSFGSLDSQIPDSIRFRSCDDFKIKCRKCHGEMAFAPISDRTNSILKPNGPICPGCAVPLTLPSIQVQLENQIREHIARYYEMWTTCSDCDNRTRMMGVYGRRCLRSACRGSVAFAYSDAQLYTQLLYYSTLFDAQRAIDNVKGKGNEYEDMTTLTMRQAEFLQAMSQTVEKYLSQCGRRWVELGSLFSFMKL